LKLKEVFDDYQRHIAQNERALFMCSCRGKMSEGLNFKDDLARACFVIGIPYQQVTDSRVVLKKKHFDDQRHYQQMN
jgi:regulator of telomere elongation helicase 1